MIANRLLSKATGVALLACVAVNSPSYAAVETATDSIATSDTLTPNHKNKLETSHMRLKPTRLILPATLIATGTFGVYNGCFQEINSSVRTKMTDMRGECYFRIDDYVQYLPVLAYECLPFTGVKAKHSLRERLIIGATAYIAMAAIVNITKYTVKEMRPDSEAHNSFPSGHTATVFAGAELCRKEYGTGTGIAAYAVATGIAFLRLYNERHWLNDVIAGAGVGILSARIGYWTLPLYKRWFGRDTDNNMHGLVFAPTCNYGALAVSLNAVYTF